MEGAPDLRSIVEAAERAAEAGDFASAGQYLRQAARLQEAELGPRHPDLANTLNNLGIACERAGKLEDAEACYRRAYAIATSSLRPDDPLVATSGQNLREFCAAQGKPFELPAVPVSRHEPNQPPGRPRRQPMVLAIISALAALLLLGWWLGSGSPPELSREPPAPPLAAESGTATPVAPFDPTPSPDSPTVKELDARRATTTQPADRVDVEVVEAQLCRTLSTATWQCTPATSPADPGVFFFYTRLKAGRETTVQHRWYFNGDLSQIVRLRILANQGSGYRTYSRNTVVPDRAGNWRVELWTDAGARIKEERFVVR